jgi:hypothetical protein
MTSRYQRELDREFESAPLTAGRVDAAKQTIIASEEAS